MPDYLTECLKDEAATVIAILTAAPFNHKHIQTFGDFTKGDLNFNTYVAGKAPREIISVTTPGTKVVVHTQS